MRSWWVSCSSQVKALQTVHCAEAVVTPHRALPHHMVWVMLLSPLCMLLPISPNDFRQYQETSQSTRTAFPEHYWAQLQLSLALIHSSYTFWCWVSPFIIYHAVWEFFVVTSLNYENVFGNKCHLCFWVCEQSLHFLFFFLNKLMISNSPCFRLVGWIIDMKCIKLSLKCISRDSRLCTLLFIQAPVGLHTSHMAFFICVGHYYIHCLIMSTQPVHNLRHS